MVLESGWEAFTTAMHKANALEDTTRIYVVGKYTQLPDAYLSVIEALHHSGIFYGRHVDIRLVNGEELTEEDVEQELAGADGILVPGGFGLRGVEGKMVAIRLWIKPKVARGVFKFHRDNGGHVSASLICSSITSRVSWGETERSRLY